MRRTTFIHLVRLLLGFLATAGLFQILTSRDLQEWLFPFLFMTGILATWVAGAPWGWAVTPAYLWANWTIFILHYWSLTRWLYGWNVLAAALGQSEALVITLGFSVVTSAVGLCAWGLSALVTQAHERAMRERIS
jgi:hypothetical protein